MQSCANSAHSSSLQGCDQTHCCCSGPIDVPPSSLAPQQGLRCAVVRAPRSPCCPRGVTFLNGADCDFSKWQEHGEAWVDSRLKCEFLGFLWGFLSSRKACDARISAFGLDERRTVYWLLQTGRSVNQDAMELNRHPPTIYRKLKRNRTLAETPQFRTKKNTGQGKRR